MTSLAPPAPRGRLQLVLLALLFFGPLVLSYTLFFAFPDLRPDGQTNYGQLVSPARPLPALQLRDEQGQPLEQPWPPGRWTYVHLAGAGCEGTCLQRLILTRQTRLAMNEKRSRVQRVLLVDSAAAAASLKSQLQGEQPDLLVRVADEPVRGFFQPAPADALYLLDPLGNWLMVYPAGREIPEDFKGLQKDLKKLLRLSQIG